MPQIRHGISLARSPFCLIQVNKTSLEDINRQSGHGFIRSAILIFLTFLICFAKLHHRASSSVFQTFFTYIYRIFFTRWVGPRALWWLWRKALIGGLVSGACLWLGPPWPISSGCEYWALFFVPSWCVD